MTLVAAIGQANALDAREAGLQATYQALNRLGSVSPALGFIVASHRFEAPMVLSGVTSLLTNVPLIGLSAAVGLSQRGTHSHGVTVALLGGDELQAEVHWFPAYSQASAEAATRILQLLDYEQRPAEGVVVCADGLNGNAEEFCSALPAGLPIIGGLSSGDLQNNIGYQIGGTQSGTGNMAAAFLRGNIKMGIGYGHGWYPVGSRFRITRSRGFWLRALDGQPASETYSQLFGQPARDWSFPPLNYMTRIYPLGFEQANSKGLAIRAPLRVEADGSFRMNALPQDGRDAYLLVGSADACQEAARQAAQQAVMALDGAQPAFALVFVDLAWQLLMQAKPNMEIKALAEILGPDVPIVGGYTLGQIAPSAKGHEHPQFLNQHIVIAVLGEIPE